MSKTFEIISKYTSGEKTLNMYAMCIVKGKTYEVKGRKLVEC